MNAELIENHVFLTFSATINEICEPLKKIGITYVTYLKNFEDGSHINLSNSAQWIEHYYKFKLYETSLFRSKLNNYNSRYFFWPTDSHLAVFKHGRNYFDSDNGITVIENADTYNEYFFFSGSRKNKWLKNLYVNNLDVLENFIAYFKNKLQDIMGEAEKSRIYIPKQLDQIILEDTEINTLYENELSELKQTLLRRGVITPAAQALNREIIPLLSKREMDIVTFLLNGQTAKETASKLFISSRTVEAHLNNIKEKLKCRNKFELVNKLLKSETVVT